MVAVRQVRESHRSLKSCTAMAAARTFTVVGDWKMNPLMDDIDRLSSILNAMTITSNTGENVYSSLQTHTLIVHT